MQTLDLCLLLCCAPAVTWHGGCKACSNRQTIPVLSVVPHLFAACLLVCLPAGCSLGSACVHH